MVGICSEKTLTQWDARLGWCAGSHATMQMAMVPGNSVAWTANHASDVTGLIVATDLPAFVLIALAQGPATGWRAKQRTSPSEAGAEPAIGTSNSSGGACACLSGRRIDSPTSPRRNRLFPRSSSHHTLHRGVACRGQEPASWWRPPGHGRKEPPCASARAAAPLSSIHERGLSATSASWRPNLSPTATARMTAHATGSGTIPMKTRTVSGMTVQQQQRRQRQQRRLQHQQHQQLERLRGSR